MASNETMQKWFQICIFQSDILLCLQDYYDIWIMVQEIVLIGFSASDSVKLVRNNLPILVFW